MLSVSDIAWEPADDETVTALLVERGIGMIDIAPGRRFGDLATADAGEAGRLRERWERRGIRIVGMQALLFGATGMNLFGSDDERERLRDRLVATFRLGRWLGADRLTLGAPRHRDRGALDDAAAQAIAVPFLRALGDDAARHGVALCLEPIPVRYGANFMTDLASTVAVLEAVAHPAIRLQLDSGSMTDNGEPFASRIPPLAHLVGHVHASEPGLVPFGTGTTDHAAFAATLRASLPDRLVTLEMARPAAGDALAVLAGALTRFVDVYRDPQEK